MNNLSFTSGKGLPKWNCLWQYIYHHFLLHIFGQKPTEDYQLLKCDFLGEELRIMLNPDLSQPRKHYEIQVWDYQRGVLKRTVFSDWWRDNLEWMEVIFIESNTWSDDVFQSSCQSPTCNSSFQEWIILT